MRILELIDSLDTGGAEKMVSSLALNLKARNHSVHIACLRVKGKMPVAEERFRQAGVNILELRKPSGFSARTLLQLARYIREHQFDIVHAHNPLVHHYAVLASRMCRFPAVLNTVHGISTLRMQPWAEKLFWMSCRLSDRVVPVCRAVEDAIRQRHAARRSRLAVIYNGIEVGELVNMPPRTPDGNIVFGTVGRLAPVKDQQTLLRAFAMAARRNPRYRLEIVGDGVMREKLERLAEELAIRELVRFHGLRSDIPELLARFDVFMLSSLSEGLPLTLLEAMAAGLPVICTAVGGVTEIVENAGCGWLCPPGKPAALASLMAEAGSSGDLRQKGMRGRSDVLRFYSIATMTSNYEALFEEILAQKQPDRPRLCPLAH